MKDKLGEELYNGDLVVICNSTGLTFGLVSGEDKIFHYKFIEYDFRYSEITYRDCSNVLKVNKNEQKYSKVLSELLEKWNSYSYEAIKCNSTKDIEMKLGHVYRKLNTNDYYVYLGRLNTNTFENTYLMYKLDNYGKNNGFLKQVENGVEMRGYKIFLDLCNSLYYKETMKKHKKSKVKNRLLDKMIYVGHINFTDVDRLKFFVPDNPSYVKSYLKLVGE